MKKLFVVLMTIMFVFAANAQTKPVADSKPKAKQETKAEAKKTEAKKSETKKVEVKKTETKKVETKKM